MSAAADRHVVGLEPWLPWPLRTWAWWTQPVRAERLAALRVALAAFLLLDILTSYRTQLLDFFHGEKLGGTHMFAYYGQAPKLNWSLLRGPGDPLLSALALGTWTVVTVWLLLDSLRQVPAWNAPRARTGTRLVWLVSGAVVVFGVWSRSIKEGRPTSMSWIMPLGMAAVGLVCTLLEVWRHRSTQRWTCNLVRTLVLCTLVAAGLLVPFQEWSKADNHSLGRRLLLSWQDDPALLHAALWMWVAVAALLMLGWQTRAAAIGSWVLTMSFSNVNPNIDNAGDTIRTIGLFYLMLCPCGAAWSVDGWLVRRSIGASQPVYVWPWPLRLLFVQMIFIYFMNGLYKITGATWLGGDSLYCVLCDLTLTRLSIAQIPVPYWVLQIATWLVLAWELSFPVLVLWGGTRWVALAFGVAFHLGILATLELGSFVPYMLCLYVPLLPWDSWLREGTAPSQASGPCNG